MDIVVKKSKIHNKGVFASKNFKRGETVLKWSPKKLSKFQINNLPEEEKHYIYKEKGIAYLMQPPERFVNHSCDANTKPINLSDVATRDIKAGEEITSNYGKDSSISFVCKCGSAKCVGVVESKVIPDKV